MILNLNKIETGYSLNQNVSFNFSCFIY